MDQQVKRSDHPGQVQLGILMRFVTWSVCEKWVGIVHAIIDFYKENDYKGRPRITLTKAMFVKPTIEENSLSVDASRVAWARLSPMSAINKVSYSRQPVA